MGKNVQRGQKNSKFRICPPAPHELLSEYGTVIGFKIKYNFGIYDKLRFGTVMDLIVSMILDLDEPVMTDQVRS